MWTFRPNRTCQVDRTDTFGAGYAYVGAYASVKERVIVRRTQDLLKLGLDIRSPKEECSPCQQHRQAPSRTKEIPGPLPQGPGRIT